MSDYTLPPHSTIVCGMTGSGKTSFIIRYLLNVTAACRFVFDDTGQMAARLRIAHASTVAQCEAALSSRWVVFNPHVMFPGDIVSAFRWFCSWTFKCSMRGTGKKILSADEIWKHCSPNQIPVELATVAQTGRVEDLELLVATQLPHKLHASIIGQSTELVCFRVQERLALDCIEDLGADRAAVESLLLGSFISYNRVQPGQLSGKLF